MTYRAGTIHTDEQMRQASRRARQAAEAQKRWSTGHYVSIDKIKEQLQTHEAEYERGQAMLAANRQQAGDLERSLLRLQGAMMTLRLLLGPEAPPVPASIATPPEVPPAEAT